MKLKKTLKKIELWISRKLVPWTHPLHKQGKEDRNSKYHQELNKDIN
jgi:hypothetical protein